MGGQKTKSLCGARGSQEAKDGTRGRGSEAKGAFCTSEKRKCRAPAWLGEALERAVQDALLLEQQIWRLQVGQAYKVDSALQESPSDKQAERLQSRKNCGM